MSLCEEHGYKHSQKVLVDRRLGLAAKFQLAVMDKRFRKSIICPHFSEYWTRIVAYENVFIFFTQLLPRTPTVPPF